MGGSGIDSKSDEDDDEGGGGSLGGLWGFRFAFPFSTFSSSSSFSFLNFSRAYFLRIFASYFTASFSNRDRMNSAISRSSCSFASFSRAFRGPEEGGGKEESDDDDGGEPPHVTIEARTCFAES